MRASVSANGAIGPDGANTADGLVADTTNSSHHVGVAQAVTAGTTYTFSSYVKAGDQPQARLNLAGSFAGSAYAEFDVTNGTVEVTGSGLIGIAAPSFDLSDHDSQRVSLGDYRGQWVVMYFYPEDDTPGCTIQATEFSAKLPELRKIDAVVLGISPDSAVEHRFFRARHDLEIRLLSDPDYRVMTLYGARREITWRGRNIGRVIRSTVLIDDKGRVAHHWRAVRVACHAENFRERLMGLRH